MHKIKCIRILMFVEHKPESVLQASVALQVCEVVCFRFQTINNKITFWSSMLVERWNDFPIFSTENITQPYSYKEVNKKYDPKV